MHTMLYGCDVSSRLPLSDRVSECLIVSCSPERLQLIRLLYETEVQYSVHYVQSAALGRRIQMQDCKGIDWESMDRDGKALRVESLEEMEQLKDPADPQPPSGTCHRRCSQTRHNAEELVPNPMLRIPGYAGGGSGASTGRQEGGHHGTTAQDRITRGHPYMFGVGRAGNLGMITRAPPLAGLEFSTTLADGLETHSLAGLRRVFACASSGSKSSNVLLWAVRAQALRRVVTSACIKHNQVGSGS